MLEIERGSTRSHCVENSLWRRLWASRKRQQNEVTAFDLLSQSSMQIRSKF